jgi:hypothetical protein
VYDGIDSLGGLLKIVGHNVLNNGKGEFVRKGLDGRDFGDGLAFGFRSNGSTDVPTVLQKQLGDVGSDAEIEVELLRGQRPCREGSDEEDTHKPETPVIRTVGILGKS